MAAFDYGARAELFTGRGTGKSGYSHNPMTYQRFTRAAEAIRFAIEELPLERLRGTYLEVDEDRFNHHEIGQLYKSERFPLARALLPGSSNGSARRTARHV